MTCPVRMSALGLAAACSLLLAPTIGHAQKSLGTLSTDPQSGITIEVLSLYEQVPPAGWLPLRLKITNGSNRDATWDLNVGQRSFLSSLSSHFSPTVAAGQTRSLDLLVPVASLSEDAFQNLSGTVSGPGLPELQRFYLPNTQFVGATNTTSNWFVLVSRSLANNNVPDWTAGSNAAKVGTRGSPIDPAQFPTEVRALMGVTTLWITPAEMDTLASAQTLALTDWVAQGGMLMLACPDANLPPPPKGGMFGLARPTKIPVGGFSHPAQAFRLGFGMIYCVAAPGGKIPYEQFRDVFGLPRHDIAAKVDGQLYRLPWFSNGVNRAELNHAAVATLVLLFGAVIGPLNLFVLAPRRRRHLLFLTTPALALGASAVAILFILLRDGLGGHGNRSALLVPLPGGGRMLTVQEQTAQTGLLTSTAFDLDPAA